MKGKVIVLMIIVGMIALAIIVAGPSQAENYGLEETLIGHSNYVHSVSWNPNGTLLASGANDHEIKIWDTSTWQITRTLTGHTDKVFSVSWNPNGTLLASGSADHTIKIWNTSTWENLQTLIGHSGVVTSVTWSPDGKQLASGSYDYKIKIWNTSTWQNTDTLTAHEWYSSLVACVSWSPDVSLMASGGSGNELRIWNTSTWGLVKTVDTQTWPGGTVRSVSWSPDGSQLASVPPNENSFKIWNTTTWDNTQTIIGHTAQVSSLSWNPNGNRLASGSDDNTIRIWNTSTWTNLQTTAYPTDVLCISWSPNGTRLASGFRTNNITILGIDSDADGIADVKDTFPADSTQWIDTDGDGYGDNSTGNNPDLIPDDPTQWNDSDGDGYGDNQTGNNPDIYPNDNTQWIDTDGDGYGDNSTGNNPDLFPADFSQWNDSDGDGYGDNQTGNSPDAFPNDNTQWIDTDGDGYGDNSTGNNPDLFLADLTQWNDSDGDGYGDNQTGNSPDAFPFDRTQCNDTDDDGYGDNPNGNQPDHMLTVWGNSTIDYFGCPDDDGDGHSNLTDSFPFDPAASFDSDGDSYPDEWNLGKTASDSTTGLNLDVFPNDPGEWGDIDGDGIGDNSDFLPQLHNLIFYGIIVIIIIILLFLVSLIGIKNIVESRSYTSNFISWIASLKVMKDEKPPKELLRTLEPLFEKYNELSNDKSIPQKIDNLNGEFYKLEDISANYEGMSKRRTKAGKQAKGRKKEIDENIIALKDEIWRLNKLNGEREQNILELEDKARDIILAWRAGKTISSETAIDKAERRQKEINASVSGILERVKTITKIADIKESEEITVDVTRIMTIVGEKVKFGVKVQNDYDFTINDIDVRISTPRKALDIIEPHSNGIAHINNLSPGESQTIIFMLKPLRCVDTKITGVVEFKDPRGELQVKKIRPKATGLVCPFIEPYIITSGDYVKMTETLESTQTGFTIKGITVDYIRDKLLDHTEYMHDVDIKKFSFDGVESYMIWQSGKSKVQNLIYLLTTVITKDKELDIVNTAFSAYCSQDHGLPSFLGEVVDTLKANVKAEKGAMEISSININQAINMVDCVVNRSSIGGGGSGNICIDMKDSIVHKSRISGSDDLE